MPRIRKSPSYLLRVGTTYHFRYSIPPKYHDFVRGEVRLSLGTGSLHSARPKAAFLANHAKEYLQELWCNSDMSLNKHDIKDALGRYLRERLDVHEQGRLEKSDQTKGSEPVISLSSVDDDIRKQLSGKKGHGKVDVKRFLKQTGLPDIEEGSPLYQYTHRELLNAHRSLKSMQNKMISNF
jgi:hypothetical protein